MRVAINRQPRQTRTNLNHFCLIICARLHDKCMNIDRVIPVTKVTSAHEWKEREEVKKDRWGWNC